MHSLRSSHRTRIRSCRRYQAAASLRRRPHPEK
ncbi:hypothetical protein RSAG8_11925, partial [Rhizoctonia solani AG-8 WAC10335]